MLELVEVEWVDHATMEGWCVADDAVSFSNPHLRTVGYLLFEDDDRYVVSNTKSVDSCHSGHGQIFNSLFSILKGTVTKFNYVQSDTVRS